MQVIIELVHIFNRRGLQSAGLLSSNGSKSLMEKYLLLVLDGKITDENILAKKLYKSDKSDARYRNLKKRVKQRLLQSIPNVGREVLGFDSEYNVAYYDCMEAAFNLSYLSRHAAYKTSLSLINAQYPVAEKYQFFDMLQQYSYFLIKINSINGNLKIVRNEAEKFIKYQRENFNEFYIRSFFFKYFVQLGNKSTYTNLQLSEIELKLNEFEKMDSDSNEFIFWKFYLKTYVLILTKKIELIEYHVADFENIINNWKFYHPARMMMFAQQKASVLFQLKLYSKGFEFCNEFERKFYNKRINWLNFKKYQFYNALKVDLSRANDIVSEILLNKFINTYNHKNIYQLWLIHNAYLQFMLKYHKRPEAKSFNLYKFINDVDLYAKDKPGYNFSIKVIELIFYLLNNERDKYIDRMTSLMAYRTRYLLSKPFKRSNVFAQLLLDVERQGFKYEILKTKSLQKYNYLASLEDCLSINDWEIVGYDHLWEIVLDLLIRHKG